ncbi:MAG: Fe-S cluster assembly protein SufD, partial [Methylococcaceae bacterium]|nr:Fe-S cluster assembly protein SufD [Methylococcaceae bacterium]
SVSPYTTLAPTLPGQAVPWLQLLRQDGLDKFLAHGFPSPRAEEWRYTNVSALGKKHFAAATTDSVIDRAWLATQQLADAWSVVLVDGRFSAELSVLADLPEAVTLISMADALASRAEFLQAYVNKAVSNDEHGFVAFNSAWFSDGVLLHIPAKLVLDKPVQILHVATQAEVLLATRTLLVVDELAQATVIESFVGLDAAYLTAAVTEVFVGANASLTLSKVQYESAKAYHFGGTYVQQARDARFTHHNFALGGVLARTDIHTDLDLASECGLYGLYLGHNRQHIDNHTRINHLKPNGISRELYKGVLADRARGVFQGRVVVAEDAQHTDSQMNNRNLLLSSDAEADTKPQLEIYADDVKCGHGVTVGQLDEKSIFYLQSRCIDEATARNMLTFAFANEMVDKIAVKSLHDLVLAAVLLRFPQEGVEQGWL